jgi:hypothetical protein
MRDREELASAFGELEALVRDTSRLPGFAAAQTEARRRRGNRIAWISGTLVVLTLAGAALVIPGWLLRDRPPVLQPSPSATSGPMPSTSATTTPGPANVLADMTPPARVRDAVLDVPAFDLAGCPSGRLSFDDTSFGSTEGTVLMEYAAVGDIDRDGIEDIVVSLRCGPANGTHGVFGVQVLAYSGPALTLLGRVPNGDLTTVSSLLVGQDGDVQLGLAQPPGIQAIVHSRYRWTGSQFEGIENVTVAAEDLPRVTVSVEPASLRLTAGGPADRVVVTIRNDGPAPALPLQLIIAGTDPVTVEITGFAGSAAASRHDLLIAPPATGESVVVEILVRLPAGGELPVGASVLAAAYGNSQGGSSSDSATVAVVSA